MLLPAPIVAEVGYPSSWHSRTYSRMAELVECYADRPLGTSDAAVVALAERPGVTEVATLDHRHFTVVRPRHTAGLTLLP
jgi:uncharacterized protein